MDGEKILKGSRGHMHLLDIVGISGLLALFSRFRQLHSLPESWQQQGYIFVSGLGERHGTEQHDLPCL